MGTKMEHSFTIIYECKFLLPLFYAISPRTATNYVKPRRINAST